MKKALSLFLVMLFVISCGAVSAAAQNTVSDKITAELHKILDSSQPNTIVRISIAVNGWEKQLKDMPSYGSHDIVKAYDEMEAYREELEGTVLPQIIGGITPIRMVNPTCEGRVVIETTVPNVEIIAASELVREVGYANFKFYPYGEGTVSEELQAILDKSAPDDLITVMVTFRDTPLRVDEMPSWPDRVAAYQEYSHYENTRFGFFGTRVFSAECSVLFDSPGSWIVAAKAKDIPRFASSGYVRDIEYYQDTADDPEKYPNIDPSVIGMLNCDVTTQTVFIELDIDAKLPKEMPSWPDYRKAHREYDEYYWSLSDRFSEITAILKTITHMTHVRGVCNEALIATVPNYLSSITKLASNEHVRYIRSFDLYDKNYDDSNIRDRYREQLLRQYPAWDTYTENWLMMYQELYYHTDGDNGTDWALVEASMEGIVACAELEQVVGGRLLWAPNTYQHPFDFDIGIFDVKQNKFFDITEIDFDDYPGLYEVWQKTDIGELTVKEQPGDADGDSEITIIDATKVQRRLANLESKNRIVTTGADADCDGEVTIMDATRIQRYKAELCDISGKPLGA